jgi:hypothetical protein
MVTPDENKENEATNDGGGPQNDKSAEIDNLGWWGTDEFRSSCMRWRVAINHGFTLTADGTPITS